MDVFWSEWFWFPENVTWKDLELTGDGNYYPQSRDLLYGFLIALALFPIRFLIFDDFIFGPLGNYFGIASKVKIAQVSSVPVLEEAYRSRKKRSPQLIADLAKKCDMTERQIVTWFRHRGASGKPSPLIKFKESAWRLVFYFTAFSYGLIMLWKSEWFWNTRLCWEEWPRQHVSSHVFWYYLFELGFFCNLLLTVFWDVKRKDFVEMLIHHLATIILIAFSFTNNFVRVGTLVMCVHDVADWMLELAKCLKYAKLQKLCDACFGTFCIVWVISRLVIFPLYVIYSASVESWAIIQPYPSWYLFNYLLYTLQFLHFIWTYFIFKALIIALSHSGKIDDNRSDSEDISGAAGEEINDDLDTSAKPSTAPETTDVNENQTTTGIIYGKVKVDNVAENGNASASTNGLVNHDS